MSESEVQRAVALGRKCERQAIVSWLRANADDNGVGDISTGFEYGRESAADRIEDGAHLESRKGGEG